MAWFLAGFEGVGLWRGCVKIRIKVSGGGFTMKDTKKVNFVSFMVISFFVALAVIALTQWFGMTIVGLLSKYGIG